MDYNDSSDSSGIPSPNDTGPESSKRGVVALPLLTLKEMSEMEHSALVSHAWRMQKAYSEVERDSRFLAWEFSEYHDSVTLFSRAAKLAHRLNASDLDTIASVATTEIPHYFNCGFAALFLYDGDTEKFRLFRHFPEHTWHDDFGAARDKFLYTLFTLHSEPFIAKYCQEGGVIETDSGGSIRVDVPESWFITLGGNALILPLSANVQQPDGTQPVLLGGLLVGGAQSGFEVKDAEISVLFSDLLSSSLYNARLVEKLNELTIIEPLTQLYNRRHLFNQLDSAMIQADRLGHPLSIVMMDIDFFKRFNDEYGHICGDEVLREVAAILKTGVRDGIDTPARYGGEEFALVMPFTRLEVALDVADRLRRSIKDNVVRFEGRELSVTCSFGVAEYVKGESAEKFIERADTFLYQAKRNGRNQVCAGSASE